MEEFKTLQILQGCENFATCRISQVVNFRNLLLCLVDPVFDQLFFIPFSQTTLFVSLVVYTFL